MQRLLPDMRIGLDFDNTIVSYDALFHAVAVEKLLVPAETPVSKVEVRDYLRAIGNEPAWTELQGYVYGARMEQAEAYSGFFEFVRAALLPAFVDDAGDHAVAIHRRARILRGDEQILLPRFLAEDVRPPTRMDLDDARDEISDLG